MMCNTVEYITWYPNVFSLFWALSHIFDVSELSSGLNVNLLLLDTQIYPSPNSNASKKKDLGLYAMNYGDTYVASVAVYPLRN